MVSNYHSPITSYQLPVTNYQLPITKGLRICPKDPGEIMKVRLQLQKMGNELKHEGNKSSVSRLRLNVPR